MISCKIQRKLGNDSKESEEKGKVSMVAKEKEEIEG